MPVTLAPTEGVIAETIQPITPVSESSDDLPVTEIVAAIVILLILYGIIRITLSLLPYILAIGLSWIVFRVFL